MRSLRAILRRTSALRLREPAARNANQLTAGVASTAFRSPQSQSLRVHSFVGKLNVPWHKRALQSFMIIFTALLAEHLLQAYQVYALKSPRHPARDVLDQVLPVR